MNALDPTIHPLPRLKICAALVKAGAVPYAREMKFSALADAVEMTPSSLSKQLSTLETAGYVQRVREYGSTRAKDTVWVALTSAGVDAYLGHVAALRELAAQD